MGKSDFEILLDRIEDQYGKMKSHMEAARWFWKNGNAEAAMERAMKLEELSEGKLATVSFVLLLLKKFKGTKKGDSSGEKKKGGGMPGGIKPSKELLQMAGAFTPLRTANLIGAMEVKITKEELLALNAKLNKIKAPKE